MELYRQLGEIKNYSTTYYNGRKQKGNGHGTNAGYKADVYVKYMDLMVELTNLYNQCDLDYYMQAFAPILTSLSGILWFLTSLT